MLLSHWCIVCRRQWWEQLNIFERVFPVFISFAYDNRKIYVTTHHHQPQQKWIFISMHRFEFTFQEQISIWLRLNTFWTDWHVSFCVSFQPNSRWPIIYVYTLRWFRERSSCVCVCVFFVGLNNTHKKSGGRMQWTRHSHQLTATIHYFVEYSHLIPKQQQ